MTATKRPIERIRDAVNYMASRMSTPQIESCADDVREACDELAAQQPDRIDNGDGKACSSARPSPWSIATIAKLMRTWGSVVTSPSVSDEQLRKAGEELCDLADILVNNFSDATPTRIDNGDGTVTFPSVPVTVLAAIVEDGSTVLRVGAPKNGERYLRQSLGVVGICVGDCDSDYSSIILSFPPAPQFREGGVYHDGYGKLCGPLEPTDNARYPWRDQSDDLYMADGTCFVDPPNSKANLLPGEVTVWQPPASLKAGGYWWDGMAITVLGRAHHGIAKADATRFFADWINPPKHGRYEVPGGGKIATWEGDA